MSEHADLIPAGLLARIKEVHSEQAGKGLVPTNEQLSSYYATFRKQFGPEVMGGLDGVALLDRMHARGTHDSLVYWLEFKDDEDFPARFGSISGGSALKFGLYQSTQTGRYMTGSPSAQRALERSDAVELARRQRDQLLAATDVLGSISGSDAFDYDALDLRLRQRAPDIADSAWGHKYLSLLYPEVLDDYHSVEYQRFHLGKLLLQSSNRRYANARHFVALARELGWPVNVLTQVLNVANGAPYRYFRVGTGDHGELWPSMQNESMMAIGWEALPDLSSLSYDEEGKAHLRAMMESSYPTTPQMVGRQTNEVFRFVHRVSPRDVVLAMAGTRVLGIGTVTGPYYRAARDYPHRRAVRWLNADEWQLPHPNEGLRTTFVELGRFPENLLAIESRLYESRSSGIVSGAGSEPVAPVPPLEGTLVRIQEALVRKRQVILYGPPGTGKTHWAIIAAKELAARSWYGRAYGQLSGEQRTEIDELAVATTCFHPAYGYEDFIEGYRPQRGATGQLEFGLRDGIFKVLCTRATTQSPRHVFLVIDEINRGDLPRIFGELLFALERDKRGRAVLLPVSGGRLVVPDNLYVIGTMNTADRSVALLDAALRRRFAFVELMPDPSVLKDAVVGGIPLQLWLKELNRRVLRHAGRDARHLQVGHSYLLDSGTPVGSFERFAQVLRDDLIPLLEEYCYEDLGALAKILGEQIVLTDPQQINHALFAPGRHADLQQAMLRAFESITATPEAAAGATEPGDSALAGEEDTDEESRA